MDRSGGVCGARLFGLRQLAGPAPPRVASSAARGSEGLRRALSRQLFRAVMVPDGKGGAALALANPVYLAITDEETLRRVASNGVPWNVDAGVRATRREERSLTIRSTCSFARSAAAGVSRPRSVAPRRRSIAAMGLVNRLAVQRIYRTFCASCHGPDGTGGPKGSSIVDGSVPRTGERPGPSHDGDCRGGRTSASQTGAVTAQADRSSSQDVSDVVAWLASKRPQYPGQPYPATR